VIKEGFSTDSPLVLAPYLITPQYFWNNIQYAAIARTLEVCVQPQ
jgi:hypothetical protein